jgi:hypothetical protein
MDAFVDDRPMALVALSWPRQNPKTRQCGAQPPAPKEQRRARRTDGATPRPNPPSLAQERSTPQGSGQGRTPPRSSS